MNRRLPDDSVRRPCGAAVKLHGQECLDCGLTVSSRSRRFYCFGCRVQFVPRTPRVANQKLMTSERLKTKIQKEHLTSLFDSPFE